MKEFTFKCRTKSTHHFVLSTGSATAREEVRAVMSCPFVGCIGFADLSKTKNVHPWEQTCGNAVNKTTNAG